MASQDTVSNVEMGGHRLVVRNAFGVVALHNATYLGRRLHGFLLYHFVVADNVEDHLRGNNG